VNDRDVEEEDMEEEEEWRISMTDDMVGGGRKEIGEETMSGVKSSTAECRYGQVLVNRSQSHTHISIPFPLDPYTTSLLSQPNEYNVYLTDRLLSKGPLKPWSAISPNSLLCYVGTFEKVRSGLSSTSKGNP
jgi:hypothetical protein